MPDSLIEFKKVVEMFDITPRTLRYYEYLELLSPEREGRKRFYGKRDLARLKLILRGRRFGLKLEEIRQMLEMYDPQSGNIAQTKSWITAADKQIAELTGRRDEISESITEIERLKKLAEDHLKTL